MSKNNKSDQAIILREILKGLSPEKMQSVGYMQVIPLTSLQIDDRFVSPNEGEFSTKNYGHMVFENPTDNLMIVPLHAGYMTKHSAQDHAMAHIGLVAKGKRKNFDTAMCIQQSQGGYIPKGKYRMLILPFSLREAALQVQHESNYGKLWQAISDFNAGFGLQKHGHLEYFLKQFAKQLDQFVAEFECVPNQVGAIILINGHVVGIERTPSPRYWKSVWTALIRECYGTLAIEYAQRYPDIPINNLRQPLDQNLRTVHDLLMALNKAEQKEEEVVKSIIRAMLDNNFEMKKEDSSFEDLKIYTLENEDFTGQMIRDETIIYASIFARKSLIKKQIWASQQDFEI